MILIIRALKRLFLPSLFAVLCLLFSCIKGESPLNPYTGQTGSIRGIVTTTSDNPLGGITVSVGSLTTYTDSKGRFFLQNIPAGERVLVNFSDDNYASTQKVTEVLPNRTSEIDASMLLTGTKQNLSTAGGSISFNGAIVNFPANPFVDSKGNAFNGTAQVKATFFDPSNNAFFGCFPGEFKGVRTDNSETQIESFGFINVEILNGAEKLNLASGKTATITFPISAQLLAKAPSTIPLWYYDESQGKWFEQGTATRVGNNYVGTVNHFSSWNCDQPTQTSFIHGRALDQNGNPVSMAKAHSEGIDYTGASQISTDDNGYFTLAVKSNSNAKVWASYHIFSSVSQNISTPATGDTTEVGNFVIPIDTANLCMITGRLIDNGNFPVQGINLHQYSSNLNLIDYLYSNKDGKFLFFGELDTKYIIEINYFTSDSSGDTLIVLTTPSSATTVDLGDIKLNIGGATVLGRVVDSLLSPLENIYVYSAEGGSNQGREYRTDSTGVFSLWVRPDKSFKIYLMGKNQKSKTINASSGALGSTTNMGDIIFP
ncbi:MAG: carboxypeptidase regulatory-like domain-containing protein [Ignavibacteriae bacterium]|nr:carboxypeptidase regulatory-like domain-containing protein [Ignavibacteriota bacterium]